MAQKSLLKLISIFVFICLIPNVHSIVIEDFEDVSDWSISGADWYSLTTSTDYVLEGTYSGKGLLHGVEDSLIEKTFSSFDISSTENISIGLWVDEADFAYDDIMEIEFKDSGASSCSGTGMSWTKTDINDEAWTILNSTGISTWSVCDTSDITYIAIGIFSGDGSDPTTCYLDILQTITVLTDSCTPPASGDWNIINGDDCTLSVSDTITGNLNISDGGLAIQNSGALTTQGGYIYVYPGSNLTIESGGQING